MESHSRACRSKVIVLEDISMLLCIQLFFFRWAAEQAKARELGDVVDFVRDLNLEKEKEHHVTSG